MPRRLRIVRTRSPMRLRNSESSTSAGFATTANRARGAARAGRVERDLDCPIGFGMDPSANCIIMHHRNTPPYTSRSAPTRSPADQQHSGERSMHAGAAGRRYNAVSDFVDANVERGLEDKIVFTDPQRTLTYGELQAATCRFGRGLQALDLRQESRIVLILLDTVDFP